MLLLRRQIFRIVLRPIGRYLIKLELVNLSYWIAIPHIFQERYSRYILSCQKVTSPCGKVLELTFTWFRKLTVLTNPMQIVQFAAHIIP